MDPDQGQDDRVLEIGQARIRKWGGRDLEEGGC
jgi:hypothetical protein